MIIKSLTLTGKEPTLSELKTAINSGEYDMFIGTTGCLAVTTDCGVVRIDPDKSIVVNATVDLAKYALSADIPTKVSDLSYDVVLTGKGAPTTSTAASSIGSLYKNIDNNYWYRCVDISGDPLSYKWVIDIDSSTLIGQVRSITPAHSNTLPSTLVKRIEYYLGTVETISTTVPTSGYYGDYCFIKFTSGATPTSINISGTYKGSLPNCEANKTYELLATWNEKEWVWSYRGPRKLRTL